MTESRESYYLCHTHLRPYESMTREKGDALPDVGKHVFDYFSKRELGLNLMTFLAARVIFSPVLGFTP